VHDAYVAKEMNNWRRVADRIGVAMLMPVFPRPETDWRIYTHALDRDSLVTAKTQYRRFDLHLIAMIDDARATLKKEKLKFDKRVLVNGFSASGMFTNRFVFLHPDRVKAATIGSPGGWPIAPVEKYQEKTLRYPIGTGDFTFVSGKKLALKTLRKVPLFIFLGDKDENDSVPFGDGYEEEDKNLIFELFGKTPVERWALSESLYKQAGLNAVFKLYTGIAHMTNREINNEIYDFLAKYAK
jgi:pimeloyl-ACP methyl ester carboxylesterase